MYDSNPKKQKKTKGTYKLPPQTKTNRPMRTSQLYMQDNNGTYTQLYTQRFETIKAVSNKRTPTVRPQQLENPMMRNPKHAAVLADIGIVYDQPLTPIEVAIRRAERIAKEKQKTAQAAAVSIPYYCLESTGLHPCTHSCLHTILILSDILTQNSLYVPHLTSSYFRVWTTSSPMWRLAYICSFVADHIT